ncbi:Protein ERGIC-53 [Halotydeus destructor]|nr:Protein ERGIC-53 [Halotydeus destructor]
MPSQSGLIAVVFLFVVQLNLNCHGQVNTNLAYEAPQKRFEYKYSFKGPYLAQKDGAVPFWEYDGNAMASDDMVRITPSLRSKRGAIWSKVKTNFDWWEVEVWLRVTGRGRLGADGVAFWFTENRMPEGPVYGAADQWRGLGIFFDSFDNDGKGNNPYVMAMLNDGTKLYDHQTDGSNQQLAGCLRDFRNKPFPVRARIEYYRNVLTVMFHSGNTNNDDEYELCLRAENIYLPQYGHFGLSAATGGLADDHDALKFLAYSIHAPGSQQVPVGQPVMPDPEKQKIDHQYEEYKAKLEKQKSEYFSAHPDEAKKYREKEEMTADHEYETLGERELQQIFDGQSQMYEALKTLNRKIDEIIGRQERTLSMVGSLSSGGVAPQGQQQQYGGGGAGGALPIQRHEVEALLGAQREVLQSSRDIRNAVLQQHNGAQVPASAQAGGSGPNALQSQLLTEIREGINVLRKEMTQVGQQIIGHAQKAPQIHCPAPPSCLSPMLFVAALVGHLAVTLAFMVFKGNGGGGAKKFY